MKSKILIGILLLLFSFPVVANNLLGLFGKVTDGTTKQPLPGAIVTIPEIRTTAITDENGEFEFKSIPSQGKFTVEVKFIGFKTLTQDVDLSTSTALNFELQPSMLETEEVVVTGTAFSANNKKNSTSVTALNRDQLLSKPSTNLIDAIARIPGIAQITTGPSISKPLIRGLGYNRVVILNDGVKQQGQQWGDEHGIEIDQYSVDRVEVLRGAASLLYGSDALGGVINFLDPLPAPEGVTKGEFISNYSINNGLSGNSLMLTGNENGFVWRARGSYKNAHSFKTPSAYLPNSGFNETSFSGMLGLNKSWGFSHLSFSGFRNDIGFYEPTVNAEGDFVDEEGQLISNAQLKGRTIAYPKQDIRHYKISLNSNIILGTAGYIKADVGFQKNYRRELENADPSLFFALDTYSADIKYYIAEKEGWQPVFGLSGDFGNSENKGIEFLIPAYDSYGIGVFGYLKKSWDSNTFNAGLRYDYRKNSSKGLIEDAEVRFEPFSNQFSNVSGALGFTHEFNDNFNFKSNIGSAFRAPNPAELGSNGVHEGTFRYEKGNPDLKPERSYQTDATLEYDNEKVDASLGIYNNYIIDYIYASSNGMTKTLDGADYSVFQYGQVNANLYGFEAGVTLHPVSFIHFENTFGYTHAKNATSNKPLPFIPAGTLRNELRFEPKLKGLHSAYLSAGVDNFFRQKRVDPQFETTTSGYTLLNAGIGATIMLKKQPLKLYISGNNLLNKKYYDHLSRFKPGRLEEANPTFGVYNAGRNITFGLYVPFNL